MKDELFVRLRPNMHSILYGGEEKRKVNGVKKCVTDKHLKHEVYKQSLFKHCNTNSNEFV